MSDTPSSSPAARLGQLIEQALATRAMAAQEDHRHRGHDGYVSAADLAGLLPAVQALEHELQATKDHREAILAAIESRPGLPQE